LTLLCRQSRIARLRNRRSKRVQDANVDMVGRDAFELRVHSFRAATRQVGYASHSEQMEIAYHRWTDRDQVSQLACL
jgi:hypothetical protein